MLTHEWLRGKPRQFQKLTGLTVAEFDVLVRKVAPLWEGAERERLSRPNRQRAIGGGTPYKLGTLSSARTRL